MPQSAFVATPVMSDLLCDIPVAEYPTHVINNMIKAFIQRPERIKLRYRSPERCNKPIETMNNNTHTHTKKTNKQTNNKAFKHKTDRLIELIIWDRSLTCLRVIEGI